jgi:hypothetical protein
MSMFVTEVDKKCNHAVCLYFHRLNSRKVSKKFSTFLVNTHIHKSYRIGCKIFKNIETSKVLLTANNNTRQSQVSVLTSWLLASV